MSETDIRRDDEALVLEAVRRVLAGEDTVLQPGIAHHEIDQGCHLFRVRAAPPSLPIDVATAADQRGGDHP